MSDAAAFARLVSLACHDIRTPLATVSGFARTLERLGELDDPGARYVSMIVEASGQIAGLVDELGIVARIEGGRYDPVLASAMTLDLVRAAARRVGEQVEVEGDAGEVEVDVEATERALAALASCALRYGGVDRVRLTASPEGFELTPIAAQAGPVLLAEDLRDLGAAAAMRLLAALKASVELDGETLRIRFEQP